MLKIAGIDNSLSCPAVTIFELDESDNLKIAKMESFIVLCEKSKGTKKEILTNYDELQKSNIVTLKPFTNEYDRMNRKNKYIAERVKECQYIAIEDYSFASKGLVTKIAENTGILKSKLYDSGCQLRTYEPTSIKMFYTGNGSADKNLMIAEYIESGNVLGIDTTLKQFSINDKSNLNDIVDSYAIATLLHTELLLRNGLKQINSLSIKQIQVFNKIHKDTKTNLLDTDFIHKEI
jgi:Holliday junction resolvasome RuvABC endonuclease subunit